MSVRKALLSGAALLALSAGFARGAHAACADVTAPFRAAASSDELAWQAARTGAIRGVTIGPIESSLHPNKGYGSPAFERTLDEAVALGATWISLTVFGRVLDLAPSGVAFTFEQPFALNRRAVARAVEQAHARGLCVLLVPHLWVESGGWRGEIELGSDAAWQRWSGGYTDYIRTWADIARDVRAEMFSVGVELRSWVTTSRASSFLDVIAAVRAVYPGLITYAGNWDDVEQTTILGALDLIGINGFYPLAEHPNAPESELAAGGRAVAERVATLAALWKKPIVFNEFGYTTRTDPAHRPWEWPDFMSRVVVDQEAQATAYRALLAPLLDQPSVAGAFVWRYYADPEDQSQEAEWGFSPRGKLAELVLHDAFRARWAADPTPSASPFVRFAAERIPPY